MANSMMSLKLRNERRGGGRAGSLHEPIKIMVTLARAFPFKGKNCSEFAAEFGLIEMQILYQCNFSLLTTFFEWIFEYIPLMAHLEPLYQ